jgi:hypothetical protein
LPPVIDEVFPEAIVPEARLVTKKELRERLAEGAVIELRGTVLR